MRDTARILAETLFKLLTTIGAGIATANGVSLLDAAVAKDVIDGIARVVLSEVKDRPDLETLVARIQDERTAKTVDVFRDTIIEAMSLRTELQEPIDKLADAVEASQDEHHDARFHDAWGNLYKTVLRIDSVLDAIKNNTDLIPALKDGMAEVVMRCTRMEASHESVAAAGSPVSVSELAPQHAKLLELRTMELREHLDAEGRRRWEALSAAMAERSWARILTLYEEMESWVEKQGDKLSPDVKGRMLLSLADVSLMRHAGAPFQRDTNTEDAWRIWARAEAVFGAKPSDDDLNKLFRVGAKLHFIDGKREDAFTWLDKTSGPASVCLRIVFLLELNEWVKASDIAEQQESPNSRWAEEAIIAHIRACHDDRAKTLLEWASSQDQVTRTSCAVAYARTIYSRLTGDGDPKISLSLSPENRNELLELQKLLTDVFAAAFADKPTSGIEAEALELAILLGHVLADKSAAQQAAKRLEVWQPVSVELGRGVLRGDVSPITGLADRILGDWPGVFTFQMLAAMLLIEGEDQAPRALDLLRTLLTESESPDRKDEVATSILIACQYCPSRSANEALGEVERAIGHDHRLAIMLRAVVTANRGDAAEAERELVKVASQDDHIWLQLSAWIAVQLGNWPMAADRSHRLAELTGSAQAYRNEAGARYRAGDVRGAAAALEMAERIDRGQRGTVSNLAAAYHELGRHREAAEKYGLLWQTEPHDVALAMNLASCLGFDGKVPQAISVLEQYVSASANTVTVELLLMLAKLVLSQGDPPRALNTLMPYWERLQVDHRYLMEVMRLGYASNREDIAERALGQLLEMRQHGNLPKGVLEGFSLEDIIKMQHGWRDGCESMNQQYLSGRLPWVIVGQWGQRCGHSYLSWHMRIQSLVPVDHPNRVAEHSLYSTNGFTPAIEEGQRRLVRLAAPPAGTTIVADISALITLHHLGLLYALGTCFSRILVPSSYRAMWIEERSRIPHHQPQQIASRQAIVKAVKGGRISLASKEVSSGIPVLDEYVDGPCTVDTLRILQVMRWMVRQGRMPAGDLSRMTGMQHQPPLVSDEKVDVAMEGGRLLADITTLRTISDRGYLDRLCQAVRIAIGIGDYQELEQELEHQHRVDEIGQKHREIEQCLDGIQNLEFVPVEYGKDAECASADIRYAFDATALANDRNVALLADDRCCQQYRMNAPSAHVQAAFGTDALLQRMAQDKSISPEQHADLLLRLIEWRYKFLVPTAEVLLTIANRFKDGLPGIELRSVAGYLQDCMRDPGLYGGPERVQPPLPMALKLFTAWHAVVTDFIAQLWWDSRFSQLQAAKLTQWAVQHLRPAWPRNLPVLSWRKSAEVSDYAFVSSLCTHLLLEKDALKARQAFNRVRRSMGISEEELASIIGFIAGSMSNAVAPRSAEASTAFSRRLLLIAYGGRSRLRWPLLGVAVPLGVVDSSELHTGTSDYVSAIANRAHPDRLDPKTGPFAYVRNEQRIDAVFLPDVLCSGQTDLRRAVLDNLLPDESCPKATETRTTLQSRAEMIRADDVLTWVSGVLSVYDLVREDVQLNMAGFAQSMAQGHNEGLWKCWARLIRPTPESLLSVDSDGWLLMPREGQSECELASRLAEIGSLVDLLTYYDAAVGHLTLSAPLDLGSQVHRLAAEPLVRQSVWAELEPWVNDSRRPWRQYHGCQAMLGNSELLSADQLAELWQKIAAVTELSLGANLESDNAQVWRLESELASHYLRIVDTGNYPLHEDRPLTTSWYAARHVTDLLMESVSGEVLFQQARDYRHRLVQPGVALARDTWTWLAPRLYSPSRFVTFHTSSPRSVALLIAVGQFAKFSGSDAIPKDVRARLRDCFCMAFITSDGRRPSRSPSLWMWDYSLAEAIEAFVSSLGDDEHTELTDHVLAVIQSLGEPGAIAKTLDQLATASEIESIFGCNSVRLYCHEHVDAGDLLLQYLRNSEWREACARTVPMLGWELLAEGMLVLQSRLGIEWAVELPYVFLRLAEASAADQNRSRVFISFLVISSLAGDTAGAVKSLRRSEQYPVLKPVIGDIRSAIESVSEASSRGVTIRLRGLMTILDQL